MPSNTIYYPETWKDVVSTAIVPMSSGTSGTCPANQSLNLDVVLSDDALVRGIEVLTSGGTFGDTVTLQIIDTNGITGVPPGTVLLTPVTSWTVQTDVQKTISYEAVVPKKALATFTLRCVYTNTSLLSSTKVAINYNLLKVVF